MAKDIKNMKRGVVIEALPALKFRVELADKSVIICYLKGKMALNNIRVLVGDKVDVIVPPGSTQGRIDYRY